MQQEKMTTCTSGSNGQPSAPSPINLASAKWISSSTTVFYCSLRLTKTIAFAAAVSDVIELYTLVWSKRLQLTMGDDDEEKSNSSSVSFNLTLKYLYATRNTAQSPCLFNNLLIYDSQIIFQIDNNLEISLVFSVRNC